MYSQPYPQARRGPGGPVQMARNAEDWLDQRGKPAWIAATVLGFVLFWPIGLALLATMIWRKKMFHRSCGEGRENHRSSCGGRFGGHWGDKFGQWGDKVGQWGDRVGRSSGNSAFDAYREETLRRLMEEQEAFQSFLQRLREAKDKAEFDAFMDDRAKAAKSTDPAPDTQA